MKKVIVTVMLACSVLCACGKNENNGIIRVEAVNSGGNHSGEERQTTTEEESHDIVELEDSDEEEEYNEDSNIEYDENETSIYGEWMNINGVSLNLKEDGTFYMYYPDRDYEINGEASITEEELKLEYVELKTVDSGDGQIQQIEEKRVEKYSIENFGKDDEYGVYVLELLRSGSITVYMKQ